MVGYRNELDGSEHVAVDRGRPKCSDRTGAGSDAFGMPDRRCLWFLALRLPTSAGQRCARSKQRGKVLWSICARKGRGIGLINKIKAWPSGRRSGHGGGQRTPWVSGRSSQLRRWSSDLVRPRHPPSAVAHQQPAQDRRPGRLRAEGGGARAAGDGCRGSPPTIWPRNAKSSGISWPNRNPHRAGAGCQCSQ